MGMPQVFGKTYELPLSKNYVRHWGMAEAVREIIQNALDSESPFEYEFRDDALIVRSRHAHLSPSTLLLGSTSKADSKDTIGSFGEGYKIACLVLAREGYRVTIHNGDRTWTPVFKRSRQFDSEVLCIEDQPAQRKIEGLAFEIGGLSPADEATIRDQTLHMQDNLGAVMTTGYGLILRDRPGKLYVGGLFVCETDMKFGYDIKPEFLSLERDRQTVSTFDLKVITRDMWFSTERFDEIAEHINEGIPDLAYAEYGAPDFVKEACYRHFKARHPGKVIAGNHEELQNLVRQGMTVYQSSSPAYVSAVQKSRSYQSCERVRVASPQEILTEWFDKNRKHMRRDGIVAFKNMIEQAGGWRLK